MLGTLSTQKARIFRPNLAPNQQREGMNGKRKEDTAEQEQFLQEFTKLNTRTQYLIYTICLADPNSTKKEIILGWIADFDDLKQEGVIENYSKLKNEQASGVVREFNWLNRFNQFLSSHNILYSNENFDSEQAFEEFTNSIFYHKFETMISEKHYEDEDTLMINPAFFWIIVNFFNDFG